MQAFEFTYMTRFECAVINLALDEFLDKRKPKPQSCSCDGDCPACSAEFKDWGGFERINNERTS